VISGDPSSSAFSALLRFPAGFVSGVHTHQHDYTAVLMQGPWQHGPTAETATEMPDGSYMTQPADEPHYDACGNPDGCVAYLAMAGPFDMAPAEASTEGEHAMTMTAAGDIAWTSINPDAPDGPQMAVIDGDPATGPVTLLLQFPEGFEVGQHQHSSDVSVVVLGGTVQVGPSADALTDAEAGAFWSRSGGDVHFSRCAAGPCEVLVQSDGPYDTTPVE
jgi:hypothetical protein